MFLHSSLKPINGNKNVKFIRQMHCLKNFDARMDVDFFWTLILSDETH
jgi:hypothetical protein